MTLFLAYALETSANRHNASAGAGRVSQHYRSLCRTDLVRNGWCDPHLGVCVCTVAHETCRWPFWAESSSLGVATPYVPFGWPKLVGMPNGPLDRVAIALAERLTKDPSSVRELDPPFAMGAYDRQAGALTILNDGIGFGRIYELSFPGGWAWSNRIGALTVFAGIAPEIDVKGWQYLAASGWFMDDTTSIRNVRRLEPGSCIQVRADAPGNLHRHNTGVMTEWISPQASGGGGGGGGGVTAQAVERVRSHLMTVVQTLPGLWPEAPIVHLSGGRDSRAVAAAVIASGIPAGFMTKDNLQGELTTVQALLARLSHPIQHDVKSVEDEQAECESEHKPLRQRVARHHLYIDAMASPNSLNESVGLSIRPAPRAHLSGAGGELAHGHYYPRRTEQAAQSVVQKLLGLILGTIRGSHTDEWRYLSKRPFRKITRHGGATVEAHTLVGQRIDAVLAEGLERGLKGLNLLDYLYLVERLRRWNNSNIRVQTLAPMVNGPFIRAAFDLQPEDRYANTFHRALIGSLVPAWADVPFYRTNSADQSASARKRIWESPDADAFADIILHESNWHDVFDPVEVRTMWLNAISGGGSPSHEGVFRRVVWRACFDDHLQTLARAATQPSPTEAATAPSLAWSGLKDG